MQTGASALLAAAAVATLYALVRFFDLFRREPSVAVEPQRIEFEPEPVVDVPVRQNVGAQLARIEEQLTAYDAVEAAPIVEMTAPTEEQRVEPAARQAGEGRRTKAPRKSGGRRASAPRKTKAAPAPLAEEEVVEFPFRGEQTDGASAPADEPFHPPVSPLFEPEPFVRQQQRAMFGRKSR